MYAHDLIEVLCAAHLGVRVALPGFSERGGIMLVGAPGVLKTSFVSILDNYSDVIMLSDINVKSLVNLRDGIANGRHHTLVLPELAKIYERMEATSANVEGTLRALVAEGFSAASFENQETNRFRAQCMVVGALTPSLVALKGDRWRDTGFARRFLWPMIRLKDGSALEKAAMNCRRIEFGVPYLPQNPEELTIPNLSHPVERQRIRNLVKNQPGGDHALHIQLMVRILSVLRWWYAQINSNKDAMATLERFAVSLGKEGGVVETDPAPRASRKQEEKHFSSFAAATLSRRRWGARTGETKRIVQRENAPRSPLSVKKVVLQGGPKRIVQRGAQTVKGSKTVSASFSGSKKRHAHTKGNITNLLRGKNKR